MTSRIIEKGPFDQYTPLIGALVVVLAIVGLIRFGTSAPVPEPTKELGSEVAVMLVQQRPDVDPLNIDVALPANATVYDAVQAAGREGGPSWASRWRGEGEMALLESLGGVESAGAAGGPEGLNWQFEVNGDYATRGAGVVRLESGDRVLWKLAPYE